MEIVAKIWQVLTYPLGTIGGSSVTPLSIIGSCAIVFGANWFSGLVRNGMEAAVRRQGLPTDGGLKSAQAIVHYVIMFLGILICLNINGIDLSSLVAAGAVFAVGVGLAMQSLAENFVAGIILILEQSIRPGDVLDVNGQQVRVQSLGIRSTSTLNRDGEHIIIPNRDLVQSKVVNESQGKKIIRIAAPVGVAYETDLDHAKRVLLDVGERMTWRRKDREPSVLLRGFGASSIDLELYVWSDKPFQREVLKSEVLWEIWRSFKEEDISIAFPQLDVHLHGDPQRDQDEPHG